MPKYSVPVVVNGEHLATRFKAGDVRLWGGNRHVDADRVAAIAQSLSQSIDPEHLGPLPIYLVRTPGGSSAILDGQHRVSALASLEDPERFNVFLCEFEVAGEDELVFEFERINCGTPVPAEYWNAK